MNRWTTIVLIPWLAVWGCPEPEKQAPSPKKAPKPVLKAASKPAPVQKPAVPVVLSGTPMDEEHHKTEVKYQGADGNLALLKSFMAPSKAVEALPVKKGQTLDVVKSKMMILEPMTATAKKKTRLDASVWVPQTNSAGAMVKLDIEAGTKVQVYKYAGEGTCILGAKGKLLMGSCPSTPDYDVDGNASKFRPKKADWWVLVKGQKNQGWVKVDGKQVVGVSKAMAPK